MLYFRLQRNELKCDIELYPECGLKGKKGAEARKKWRPDSKEAMWTKIIRALRLASLEVQNHNLKKPPLEAVFAV